MSCFFLAFPKNAQKKITQEKSLRFLLRFLLRLFYNLTRKMQFFAKAGKGGLFGALRRF
jgi:hypothetical protein